MNGYQHKSHILLTNDDGLEFDRGLKGLINLLSRQKEVKLTAVIPVSEQSAVSHSITILAPVFINKIWERKNGCLYSIKGTPTDCIKLALGYILKRAPDFTISGINLGANVGLDIFYSGTVAAAIESSFWGITSFAVSLEREPAGKEQDIKSAAKIAYKTIRSIIRTNPREGSVFNINIPAQISHIKGVKYTRQDLRLPGNNFITGLDPRGRRYYWMKPTKTSNESFRKCQPRNHGILTDVEALKLNYISITPLQAEFTDKKFLSDTRKTLCPLKIK